MEHIPTAADFLAKGRYQRSITAYGGYEFTANTESDFTPLADNIVTPSGEEALFTWIRMYWVLGTIDEPLIYEWFVVKCNKNDALQDMSTASVMEALQKEGRILKRGVVAPSPFNVGAPKVNKLELFQIQLPPDWELRLIIVPQTTVTTAHGKSWALTEWRQAGQ